MLWTIDSYENTFKQQIESIFAKLSVLKPTPKAKEKSTSKAKPKFTPKANAEAISKSEQKSATSVAISINMDKIAKREMVKSRPLAETN